ncbi:MAG: hypothetical protein P8Y93_09190, partial [Acidobacteriota bacterium]
SLATAQAMEHSASRHLRRRQLYTRHMIADLTNTAYTRAYNLGKTRAKPNPDLIAVDMTDIDRVDNRDLASAAHTIAQALDIAARATTTAKSTTLRRLALRLILRFGGEQLDEDTIDAIIDEAGPLPDTDPPGGEE